MNGCELAIAISTFASAVAAQIEDDEDLNVLAASITQFGDTLATIAAWRARCAAEQAKRDAKQEAEQKKQEPDQKNEQTGAEEETVVQSKKL